MQAGPWIRDISDQSDGYHALPDGNLPSRAKGEPIRMTEEERKQFAELDISVSDTETTGRPPQDLGLTELASQRATIEADGKAHHWMFQAHILPLRPQYQDYLAAVAEAKRTGAEPPAYDRRRYEYEIDPRALAVTGTELIRERKDGPIIGMKINGEPVENAVPFYAVMDDFLAFVRNGERDSYYNMPFDARVLASQIADVRAYNLARTEQYRNDDFLAHAERLIDEKSFELLQTLAFLPYHEITPEEQHRIAQALKPLTEVPTAYTNPASFRCLYHGYLAKQGFEASNRLDDAYRTLIDPSFDGREEHKADEDVTMATRVALKLAHSIKPKSMADIRTRIDDDSSRYGIATVADLFRELIARADPAVQVTNLPSRVGPGGNNVEGDLRITFSQSPSRMNAESRKIWDFLVAFERARNANPRIPKHLLEIDEAARSITINAERSSPLSLNLLKKITFFMQLQENPVVETLIPHHSTGTEMDVALKTQDTLVENVHYPSFRANLRFLTQQPHHAADYLQLIAALHKADDRIGMVLLRPRSDGALDIALQGQVKAFGEVVLHLPAGAPIAEAIPSLQREAQEQMKLGAIPHVAHNGLEEEEQFQAAESSESEELRKPPATPLSLYSEDRGERMRLRVAEPIAELMAYRLGHDLKTLIKQGSFSDAANAEPVAIRRVIEGQGKDRKIFYEFSARRTAFHSFVTRGGDQAQGERPSNLIKDASWLLYRLEQLPGTYGLTLKDGMAILDQRDGVSVEALGLLYGAGIPFKAYGHCIKVDARQLMQNAFHWSVTLSRRQKERMIELRAGKWQSADAPAQFLEDNTTHLLQHPRAALETNEAGTAWLLDGSRSKNGEANHYPLAVDRKPRRAVQFHNERIVPHESGLQNSADWWLQPRNNGNFRLTGNPVLVQLAMHQLGKGNWIPTMDGVEVTPQHEKEARRALRDAAKFMLALGNATGSARLPLERAWITDEATVELTLPNLEFLKRPRLFIEMMDVNRQLVNTQADQAIRKLQQALPDPIHANDRRDDAVKLCDEIVQCHGTLRELSQHLERYLRLLGGGQYRDDAAALSLTSELKQELATLGTIMHEMQSSAGMLRGNTDEHLQHDITSAQDRLSDVAFGAEHLREDLAVARKRIESFNKHGKRDGGLIKEAGKAMAALMGDYANELALSGVDVSSAMEEYRETVCQLFDREAETLAPYTERATLRSLVQHHDKPDSMHPAALHYLLQQSFPSLDRTKRDAIITLYRTGESSALQHSMPAEESGLWLRQYHLLTGREHIAGSITEWKQMHQGKIDAIENEIAKLYERRGHRYRKVAQLYENASNIEEHAEAIHLRSKARHCFHKAGFDDEAIDAIFKRGKTRSISENDAKRSREIVGLQADTAIAKLDLVRATIDQDGMEEEFRQRRHQHGYNQYKKDIEDLTLDANDPDFHYKQRRSMLQAVKHYRKESHDVLMGKRHFLRDLQALLVMGQQDARVSELFAADETEAIRTIGEAIRSNPEMVGLHENTVPNIQSTLEHANGQLQQNVQQFLQEYGVSSQASNHRITCSSEALARMYDQWRTAQKVKPQKPMPEHMNPWVDRVTSRLQHSRDPVKRYGVDFNDRTIPVTVALAADGTERTRQWARLQFALHGTGLTLPTMPDTGGDHRLSLRFTRAVERGHAAFDRDATRRDAARALRQFAVAEGMQPEAAERMVRKAMRNQLTIDGLRAEAYQRGLPPDEFDAALQRRR